MTLPGRNPKKSTNTSLHSLSLQLRSMTADEQHQPGAIWSSAKANTRENSRWYWMSNILWHSAHLHPSFFLHRHWRQLLWPLGIIMATSVSQLNDTLEEDTALSSRVYNPKNLTNYTVAIFLWFSAEYSLCCMMYSHMKTLSLRTT